MHGRARDFSEIERIALLFIRLEYVLKADASEGPRALRSASRHRFHLRRHPNVSKVSKDGSGKCDAEATGDSEDRVYGVLYSVPESEKRDLDRAEGLGSGYEEEEIEVHAAGKVVKAFIYRATSKDAKLRPYHWYKAYVVAGAVEHGLPLGYIELLRAFESVQDPDSSRRRREQQSLTET